MGPNQRRFVAVAAEFLPEFFVETRVLEVGALDVNGSVRDLFRHCDYTGIDVGPGPGVDVVCGGHEYDADDASFDVVLSTETMEHNPHWVRTVENMLRLCRLGGLVLVSCATLGRPEHGTVRSSPLASPPTVALGWDYYRNVSERGLRRTVASARDDVLARYWTNWRSYDLYMASLRGPVTTELRERFNLMSSALDADVRRENRALHARLAGALLTRPHGESVLAFLRRAKKLRLPA